MNLLRNSVYILAVFLCITFNDYVYSDIYRWTDESGKIHFSDKKPQRAINTERVEALTANQSTIRLDVPLVKQGKALCGPATIEMLFRYWGVDSFDQYDIAYNILLQYEDSKRVKQSKILDATPIEWNLYPGTGTANMREFLKRFAKVENPKLKSIPSNKYLASKEADNRFEALKSHISRGVPVIVHQYWGDVGSNGHYRIVSGYDDKKRQVYLNDSTHGSVVTQSYDRFLELWNVNESWLHFNAIVFNINKEMIKPNLKRFDGQRPTYRK
tara:strand:- start:1884 stop:2696 length:813 start_codon:yes stop_codon:yes gene_type:complete